MIFWKNNFHGRRKLFANNSLKAPKFTFGRSNVGQSSRNLAIFELLLTDRKVILGKIISMFIIYSFNMDLTIFRPFSSPRHINSGFDHSLTMHINSTTIDV